MSGREPIEIAFWNGQVFEVLTPDRRPQDEWGDGRGWRFRTFEHGGDVPDNMPQAIEATDPQGRWAVYVPLSISGTIVVPKPGDNDP